MPIRHVALAALFAVLALSALSAPAMGAGSRYEQAGEHYDVSISYPVLRHPAVDADIGRIVWKLTDAFRRMAGHGLLPQSAAGHRNASSSASDGSPQAEAEADIYAPARRDWLTATHRISRPSANAVSVIFEVQTGLWGQDGAAVSCDLLAVSYDLAAGRRIELDDLFGDDDCADAVLAAHLRQREGATADGQPPADGPARATPPSSGAETPVTFWLTPRGLMLLAGSCCWQNASTGGSSCVPGTYAVDARKTPADPPPAVEVPIEPLLHCAPHLSYWGRVR